jgi:hypothetical protein
MYNSSTIKLKVWPIFCANSDFLFCFIRLLQFFKIDNQKMSKTHFFKWQLPFLTVDINVKFNFKATFMNIVYAYFQPFWHNFLNKIFFFYQTIVLFEFLYKNRIVISSRYVTK